MSNNLAYVFFFFFGIGKDHEIVIVIQLMNKFPPNLGESEFFLNLGKHSSVAEHINNILESIKTKTILLDCNDLIR